MKNRDIYKSIRKEMPRKAPKIETPKNIYTRKDKHKKPIILDDIDLYDTEIVIGEFEEL